MIPILSPKLSLFIPELPGYGISSPTNDSSKLAVGRILLDALLAVFALSHTPSRRVVLGGHDRGARIVHRLLVSRAAFPHLNISFGVMLDILPTAAQYERFSDPAVARAYFHWPLLSNAEYATQLIKAYGGARWCREMHRRLAGGKGDSMALIEEDGALDVYAALFEKEETLRGSADDYEAGATVDLAQQLEDQKEGRKINIPVMIMYSERGIGARTDVPAVWREWAELEPGQLWFCDSVGDGVGHFLPEEAYYHVARKILSAIHMIGYIPEILGEYYKRWA
jgi:pimeloyl-ACP methyl ester carboxylesterase